MNRYHRQILLPEIGEEGQKKLAAASVVVVGLGGLGSPVALYLAGAGIGKLGIVDSEDVEVSNLHRQILYTTDDLGKKKSAVAFERLSRLNPEVKITPYDLRVTLDNVQKLITDYDLVIDCSDNFSTRYLMNEACVKAKKTLLHGAIFRTDGQVTVIKPGETPCLNCIFPKPKELPTKVEGVLGPTAGLIATILATEAIKLILDTGDSLTGKLLIYDSIKMNFRKVNLKRDEKCSVC